MPADSADAILFPQHFLVAVSVYALILPLALLDVVGVAQALRIEMVVAAINHAFLGRLLAIKILGMPMPQ